MEYVQRLGQQLGAIINNAIDNAIAGVGFLSEEEAIFLLENQIQPKPPFEIDTFYTQVIIRYGDGFFDLDATKLTDSNYDPDSFDRFIDNIKKNIDNNTGSDNGSYNFSDAIKLKYRNLFESPEDDLESPKDDEEEKIALKIALNLLKNSLLTELGVYNFFLEKCRELENKTDIKSRAIEYATHLSLSYEQQDFNEFFRNFIDTSKVENFFKSTKGQIEEEASLIFELSAKSIDLIEDIDKLHPTKSIIRKATVDEAKGEVLATIHDLSIIRGEESQGSSSEPQDTTISIKENSNPSFFSIPLNRAEYIDGQAIKNKKAIKFNDNFTISQKKFELTDIIMHSGEGLENGHYYTISKRKIKLNNGREHTVFLQHNDEATKCFIKFGNEVQCRNIKDVENLVDSYEFATLADIKGSKKIEQNFVNIVYQTYIPSSKINEVYQGLKNYGNSCYINSFLAVVAGMNDGSEKKSLLAELEKNGIKFSDNKFSNTDENKNMQDLVNALRINRNEVQPAYYDVTHNEVDIPENPPETTIQPSFFAHYDATHNKVNIPENPPETTIHPKCHSSVHDFYKNFNFFSRCEG